MEQGKSNSGHGIACPCLAQVPLPPECQDLNVAQHGLARIGIPSCGCGGGNNGLHGPFPVTDPQGKESAGPGGKKRNNDAPDAERSLRILIERLPYGD